jgi:Na+:H+ antiporter, NhaA family
MTDSQRPYDPPDAFRPKWSRAGRALARVVEPLQAFLETETSSAVLLLGAAVVALVWANSPVGDSYARLWGTELSIGFGGRAITGDLRWWVSDGLMTVFFFLVGLELKREFLFGELQDRRRAALPVVAALGGMLVPAGIYLAFTFGTEAARGVGIAMPTDIVFALGVLALARGTPLGLKALLLSLAIVDDLGSIVIVAFAYGGGVGWVPLAVGIALFAAYRLLWVLRVRVVLPFVVLGVAAWAALVHAHVAPTLAGVVLAFLTPAVAAGGDPGRPSPLARAEAFLLPWSSYVIVPLFALANAGIRLSADAVAEATTSPLGLGILASRVIGKPLGIVLACLVAFRLGLGGLPPRAGRRAFVALGAVAGIPFTVSLFVARIALPAPLVGPATVSILIAALVAGVIGFALVRRLGRSEPQPPR